MPVRTNRVHPASKCQEEVERSPVGGAAPTATSSASARVLERPGGTRRGRARARAGGGRFMRPAGTPGSRFPFSGSTTPGPAQTSKDKKASNKQSGAPSNRAPDCASMKQHCSSGRRSDRDDKNKPDSGLGSSTCTHCSISVVSSAVHECLLANLFAQAFYHVSRIGLDSSPQFTALKRRLNMAESGRGCDAEPSWASAEAFPAVSRDSSEDREEKAGIGSLREGTGFQRI